MYQRIIATFALLVLVAADARAQFPKGGRPSPAGGRPSMPSMLPQGGGMRPARPAAPAATQRPGMMQPQRPGGPAIRPATPIPQPPIMNRPAPSPVPRPATRPGIASPGVSRPNPFPGGVTRPSVLPGTPATRPSVVPRPPATTLPAVRPPVRPGPGLPSVRPPVGPPDRPRPPVGPPDRPRPPYQPRPPIVGPPVRPPVRPPIGPRPPWGGTNINQSINNITNNQFNYWNRPSTGPWHSGYYGRWGTNPGVWYGHYHNYYSNWHGGGWSWFQPPSWNSAWSAFAFGWLVGANRTLVYSNPYYVAPLQPVVNIIDYSRPLIRTDVIPPVQDLPTDVPVIPQVIDTPPTADEEVLKAKRAAGLALFEQAREAFKNGEYARSEELIDAAIPDLPGDPTPHEFRALVLFARGKYQDAAAAIYAVLSAGPGWNWETLRALYPTVDTYTQHLRTLERYRLEHADRTDASFLLAYHYLTIGELQPATRLLENVVKLNPTDQLSSAILKALTTPKGETDRPKAGG